MYDTIDKRGLYDPRCEHENCGVGFIVNIRGRASHSIVRQGVGILNRLAHRGAVGADPKTGDGAGILLQLPHEFFSQAVKFKLPPAGAYGVGLVFLPRDEAQRKECKAAFGGAIESEGQTLLGWREVPVNDSDIGRTARNTQPVIEQVFIGKGRKVNDRLEFERRLYQIRRQMEKQCKAAGFYITNLSSRTVAYKGLLMPGQISGFFPDLSDERLKSAIALVHSRYSTNTFPTWDLSQPFRLLAHNGEINTLRGNVNWMKARGLDVILPGGSDSAALDNVLELLVLSGRSLPHAIMMLIPQAWEHNPQIDKKLKDFYRYHACFMEPWDGPAAVAFTDGTRVGAVLDRNGLRPARYVVTSDDEVIMASEVGVIDTAPESIITAGRLEPGKIFYIDTEKGKIINDDEIKAEVAGARPYGEWLENNLVEMRELTRHAVMHEESADLRALLKAFGYTREDMRFILKPMAEKGSEPIGSMGNDTPHAVLSLRPQPLFNYFKQLFAQVTNPAVDAIREKLVMSLESFVGSQKNILEETPEHCRKLLAERPLLTNEEFEKIRMIQKKGLRTKTVSLLFDAQAASGLAGRLDAVCEEAVRAIEEGNSFIILSDRGVSEQKAAIPSLLAVGAVHHCLIAKALRTRAGIVAQCGDAREVHHFALLFGYGADLVHPYLAYEAIGSLAAGGDISLDATTAVNNFRKAIDGGLLKILSKMGISTLHSYRGAQIFEALGLEPALIDRCFFGTASRIGGADLEVIAAELLLRHQAAFRAGKGSAPLESGGIYQWKRDGEFHLWNPDSIAALQDAVRKEDYGRFRQFSRLIDDQSKHPTTLRSLFRFRETIPVPLEEVEPVENILKRFATGAMSFGSISRGAHETLAIAMNRIGGRSNTGEGGEDPARFGLLPNGDSSRSSIKQVASGRFGVTTNYLVNADELQIKIAQGAKPGEGGQLPGHKVSAVIARTRYTTPGVTLISPPPHHDIYSIEDLAQLIFDLKNVNPRARISVKLVSEVGVGTVAAGVAKGHADMILISGGDGGTGASPMSSIRHAGLPWELGLAEVHQTLVLNDLRSRVRLQTDGQIRTGRDVAIAALLGAEEFGFATAPLIAMGCVMLRHCHLNNCSVGVATQDELLSRRFAGRPEYVVNFMRFVAQELREIMAQLGVRRLDDLIGRADLLEIDPSLLPWKAKKIDYSAILCRPEVPAEVGTHYSRPQEHGTETVLDRKLIELAKPSLERAEPVRIKLGIRNYNRTTGAMLSGEVCKKYGERGLPDDTIHIDLSGVAGQSFGAWLARGITLELEGMANDYVGKGISGGRIIIYPDRRTPFKAEENVTIGNTTFYGAIEGEAFIRGKAGERFCIRNSGLFAVVEGVGDHGCEYMTGGRVLVLGPTGRNFAAGMSGGVAYVYDRDGTFQERCNQDMVLLENLLIEDESLVRDLLQKQVQYTGSPVAADILADFRREKGRFVKVMPIEYKRILLERAMDEEELDLLGVSDG